MPAGERHKEVESQFRQLISDAELAPPDAVEYAPESVVFFWNEPQVAVVVDLDEAAASRTCRPDPPSYAPPDPPPYAPRLPRARRR
jgi:hypothetical protein